jgi:hypothetical protein
LVVATDLGIVAVEVTAIAGREVVFRVGSVDIRVLVDVFVCLQALLNDNRSVIDGSALSGIGQSRFVVTVQETLSFRLDI